MRKMKTAIFLIFLLNACSLMPEYQRPAQEVPAQWNETQEVPARWNETQEAPARWNETQKDAQPEEKGEATAAQDWWLSFNSAGLGSVMEAALARNNDLLAGLQRIEQSRAALRISGASLLPSAGASGGATRARETGADAQTALRAGAGVSYELDLFGANRAALSGAKADFAASRHNQRALALVVMSDVARTYFNVLNARDRLKIADNNLANAREILRIVQARLDAGAVSELELSQQKTAVASVEAGRASLEQQLKNAKNALAILLGKPPGAVMIAEEKIEDLTVPDIAPGQPSRLLEHRPDIKSAEAGLIAANADIGIARAAFFPDISLGLDAGANAAGLGDPVTTALSLAASLTAPIFEGGRLEGGIEQTTARQKELEENYRKTVLTAFQEVEDALAAVKASRTRERALAAAAGEAGKSHTLTKQLFDAGAIDFQTFLDTQDRLLKAEDSYAVAKTERLSAAVDLFKALGGGWISDGAENY